MSQDNHSSHILKPVFFCIDTPPVAYLSIPKNACTSIKFAIASLRDESLLNGTIPIAEIHWRARSFFDRIVPVDNDLLNNYFKFSFVRNPYTRFLSFYRNKVLGKDQTMLSYFKNYGIEYEMPINECLKVISQIPIMEQESHFAPQHVFIFDQNNNSRVDFIGKIESFENDCSYIERSLNCKIPLFKHNVTYNKYADDYNFDEETLQLIFSIYKDDFIKFGYDPVNSKTN